MRKLLFLIFIWTPILYGVETHIIIDMEGTLVKNVPGSHQGKTTTVPEYEIGGALYVLRPEVIQVLETAVDNPEIKISFVSTLPRLDQANMDALLSQIQVKGKSLKDHAHMTLGPAGLTGNQVNLEAFGGDLSNSIFISDNEDKVMPGQEGNQYVAGNLTFAFDNTALLNEQREAIAGGAAHLLKYVPADDAAWKKERDKWKGIHTVMREVRVGNQAGLASADILKNLKNSDQNISNFKLGPISEPVGPVWKISRGKVTGCELHFTKLKQKIEDLATTECIGQLGSVHKVIDKDNRVCGLYTKDGKALIKEVEPLACFGKKGETFLALKEEYLSLCESALKCNQTLSEIGSFTGQVSEILKRIKARNSSSNYEKLFLKLHSVILLAGDKISREEEKLWTSNRFDLTRESLFQDLNQLLGECQLKQYEHLVDGRGYPPFLAEAVVGVTGLFGEEGAPMFESAVKAHKNCVLNKGEGDGDMLNNGCPTSGLISSLGSLINNVVPNHVEEQTGNDDFAEQIQEEVKNLLSQNGSQCQWDDSLRDQLDGDDIDDFRYNYYAQREFTKSAEEFKNCAQLASAHVQKRVSDYQALQKSIEQGKQNLTNYLKNHLHAHFNLSRSAFEKAEEVYNKCMAAELKASSPRPDYIQLGCSRGAALTALHHMMDEKIMTPLAKGREEWRVDEARNQVISGLKNCGWDDSLAKVRAGGLDSGNFNYYTTTKQNFEMDFEKCQEQAMNAFGRENSLLQNESRFLADLKKSKVEDFGEPLLKSRARRERLLGDYGNFGKTFEAYLKDALLGNQLITKYTSDRSERNQIAQKAWDEFLKPCLDKNLGKKKNLIGHCQTLSDQKLQAYLDTLMTPAQKSFYEDWKPYIRELSREVYVYHWYDDNAELRARDNDPVKLMQWYRSAWDDISIGEVGYRGTGLYAAHDPQTSNGAGSYLARIQIPRGTKYLESRNYGDHAFPSLSSETDKKMRAEGCFMDTSFPTKSDFSQSDECHKMLLFVMKKLGAEFLTYDWANDNRYCRDPGEIAFYFTTFEVNNSNVVPVEYRDEELYLRSDNNIKDRLFGCDPTRFPSEERIPRR